jgi:hypothetical protein
MRLTKLLRQMRILLDENFPAGLMLLENGRERLWAAARAALATNASTV